MFQELERINHRPQPFEYYTTALLWTDPYLSQQMLALHLDQKTDLASRKREFIQKAGAWILDHFALGPASKICDFGCGPGLYTTLFAKGGAQVTGIDFSERSILHAQEEAKRQQLPIHYLVQDYLKYKPNKLFDLITMIYCDFSVLSPLQRKVLLRTMYDSIEDEGFLLFDLYSIEFFNANSEKRAYEYVPGNGFWSTNPYYAFTNTFKYEQEKLILDKHTVIDKHEIKVIYNWFQCYTVSSIEAELNSCGFQISEVYSDVSGTPFQPDSKEMAVVAKKLRV